MERKEINKHGNLVKRGFISNGDRYGFDFNYCSSKKGWQQFDTQQDAWYFGIWVHPEKREILTYAEGDITRVVCPTEKSFKAELKTMARFYGSPPPAFTVISQDGKVTEYYDERPK